MLIYVNSHHPLHNPLKLTMKVLKVWTCFLFKCFEVGETTTKTHPFTGDFLGFWQGHKERQQKL